MKRRIEMRRKGFSSPWWVTALIVVAMALSIRLVSADDLTDSDRFLCTPIQATLCVEDGECAVDLPWNVNIPQFIEVDLEAKRLATTAASGENRATPIEHLRREDGNIVFHGFEMGRAFSWVIDEATGRVTAAIATDGISVAIFGACTPAAGDGRE
jgi:hypothetical protein